MPNAIPRPTSGGWYRRRSDGATRWVEALAVCVHTGQELVVYSRQGAQWGEAEVEPLEEFLAYAPGTDFPRWEPLRKPEVQRRVTSASPGGAASLR